MANEATINHIEVDGVDYEFVDSKARSDIAKATKRINDSDDRTIELVNAEKSRAMAVEEALQSSKVSKEGNKQLSDLNFTQEIYDKITDPAVFKGATSEQNGERGIVPQPKIENKDMFLKGNGKWEMPQDTTYELASHTMSGLMSSNDKYKLDTMDTESDNLQASETTFGETPSGETQITEVIGGESGKVKTTVFRSDGSIKQTIKNFITDDIVLVTTFNADGSISRTRQ